MTMVSSSPMPSPWWCLMILPLILALTLTPTTYGVEIGALIPEGGNNGSPSPPRPDPKIIVSPLGGAIPHATEFQTQSLHDSSSSPHIQPMSNPVMTQLRSYQLVRPQQIMSGNEAIMEQMAPGDHPMTLSYKIQAFDKMFELSLAKNTELFAPDYQQIRLSYDVNDVTKAPQVERTPVVHCYYQGTVLGDPNSHVAMSTCNGLRGSIQAHGESLAVEPAYYTNKDMPSQSSSWNTQGISASGTSGDGGNRLTSKGAYHSYSQPAMNGHPLHAAFPLSRIPNTDHLVFRQSDLLEAEKSCGVEGHDHSHDTPSSLGGSAVRGTAPVVEDSNSESLSGANIDSEEGNTAGIDNNANGDVEGMRSPSTNGAGPGAATNGDAGAGMPNSGGGSSGGPTGQETIELLVFNDKSRWDSKGEGTEADSLAIVNSMKNFYATTAFSKPVRVVLVGQVTFSQGDPYSADMKSDGVAVEGERGLLQAFHRYRNSAGSVIPRHDNGQLFSERKFTSNIMGLAGVGSMCSDWSGSITCMTSPSLIKNAMIAAHETGHTLSMMHDGVYNTCPSGGFIMQTTTGLATSFSSCSISSANTYFGSGNSQCLYNYAARQASIRGDSSWLASVWSECSTTCGTGLQVRDVECRSAAGKVLDATECNAVIKPKAVRMCNASVECDVCSIQNCSGVGVCRNGQCLCPQGTAGTHCEINVPIIKESQSDKATVDEQHATTSKMALALTAALTGLALACATFIWIYRVIRRWRNDKLRMKMLSPSVTFATSPSLTEMSNDTSGSGKASGPGTPIPSSASLSCPPRVSQSSSFEDDTAGLASYKDRSHSGIRGDGINNGNNNDNDIDSKSCGACHGVKSGSGHACGLHKKTPRSIPRTISVE